MQPDERNAAYLWDMLEAAREVIDCTRGVSFEHFMANRVLMRATERSVEIIGEAARHVSPEFIAAHPEIPWRQIIGQRNILAHEYGQIDHEMLFKTATLDVPALISTLEKILPPVDE